MEDFERPKIDPSSALRRRHNFALILIALLLTASQLAVQIALSSGGDDSRVINVAGRQRMLSQGIAKLALELSDAPAVSDRIGLVRELYENVMTFQGTHDGLLAGSATLGTQGRNSPAILALYRAIETPYQAIVAAASELRIVAVAPENDRARIAALKTTILAQEGEFLDGMNSIVWRYDSEAGMRRHFLKLLEYVFFGLILLALLAEALFIFRPAEKSLSTSFSDLNRALEALREKATYDPLTGLYNRGTGLLLLPHELDRARRSRTPLTLCFIDLDGLKPVNDNFGHDEGDLLLKGFGELLKRAIRSEDTAFRHGGDEFVLVLGGDEALAERVLARLASLAEEENGKAGRKWRYAFSHGLARFDAGMDETGEGDVADRGAEELLAAADAAMYRMKEEHRKSGASPTRT